MGMILATTLVGIVFSVLVIAGPPSFRKKEKRLAKGTRTYLTDGTPVTVEADLSWAKDDDYTYRVTNEISGEQIFVRKRDIIE